MLTILPAPDHVAAYRLMQTLTGEDVDAIMADIGIKLAHTRRSACSSTSPISPT